MVVVERRRVAQADQLATLYAVLQHPFALGLFADLADQLSRKDQPLAGLLVVHDPVFEILVDGRERVADERPRRRRPDEQTRFLSDACLLCPLVHDDRKADEDARVVHLAVALADFAGRESRAALCPPPDDLVALVEQAAVEEGLERPPDALDVALVIGDVGLVEVDPEAEAAGERLPLLCIAKDGFEAFAVELLDAVLLDLVLAMDAEFLADLDFDRQAVRVPAGLPLAVVAAHGAIARKQVLDRTCQAVAGVGQPIGGGRAFVKDKRLAAAAAFKRLFVNAVLVPEGEHVALGGGKVEFGRYFLEHSRLLLDPPHARGIGGAKRSASIAKFGRTEADAGERGTRQNGRRLINRRLVRSTC